MTQKHKELNEIANFINSWQFLTDEITINRRNGYYAVDRYTSEGSFLGILFAGNFKEVHTFLTGIKCAYFYQSPF